MLRTVVTIFLLSSVFTLYGQNPRAYNLPELTPQTPNAYAFQKFGNIPVSYNTGYANLSVDLYEIDLGSVRIPIRLLYQNNGLKTDEIPTWVGHGWNLEVGGVITYNQRGKNDAAGMLLPGVYARYLRFMNGQMATSERYFYLDSIVTGKGDGEFDLYNFNFLGRTGEFFFRPDGTIQTTLDQGLKIVKTTEGFRITDAAGTQFFFESKERNAIHSNCGDPMNPEYNDNSAYFLTRIVTAGKRTVSFRYKSYPLIYNRIGNMYYHRPSSAPQPCPVSTTVQVCSTMELSNLLMDSILFDNGAVKFEHSATARLDVKQIDPATTLPSLNAITITNLNGVIIRKYAFVYEYFSNNSRLKLKKLRQVDGGMQASEYTFEYYVETGTYPHFFSNAQDHAGYYNGGGGPYLFPKTDYSFLPLWNTSLYLADRNSQFLYAQLGLLKKITYPTGGYSEFIYEPNQLQLKSYSTLRDKSPFFDLPVNRIFDGTNVLMQNSVNSSPVSGSFTVSTQTFVQVSGSKQYDPYALMNPEIQFTGPAATVAKLNNLQLSCAGSLCQGTTTIVMEPGTYSYNMTSGLDFNGMYMYMSFKIEAENNKPFEIGGGRIKKIINNSLSRAGEIMEKEIVYDDREDSVSLKLRPNYIKSTLISASVDALTSVGCGTETTLYEQPVNKPQGGNILYNRVTEIIKGPTDIGKTVIRYKPNNVGPYNMDPYAAPQLMNWRYNIIESAKLKNVGSSGAPSYALAAKTIYDRVSDSATTSYTGFKASYSRLNYGSNTGINQYNTIGTTLLTERFYDRQLDDFLYDGSDFIEKSTFSTLSINHPEVTTAQTGTSSGEMITQRVIYSRDYNTTGAASSEALGIMMLKDSNINLPIEAITIRNNNGADYVTAATLTTYKSDRPVADKTYSLNIAAAIPLSSFAIASISGGNLVKDSRYEERLAIIGYDEYNNPRELKKTGDITMAYIWDYRKMYVVAECANADTASIAFTSFEADGKGGWIFNGTASTTYALTGIKSYYLGGGNITRNNLVNKTYVISYWGRGGSSAVNGAGPSFTGKTISGWTYYEHEVTGTVVAISGSNYIDELRLYPKGATMTTYTYEPLVGITSKCDVASQLTFFSYDTFGRLSLIRDQDKNIIRKICYNYAGQPENCR